MTKIIIAVNVVGKVYIYFVTRVYVNKTCLAYALILGVKKVYTVSPLTCLIESK